MNAFEPPVEEEESAGWGWVAVIVAWALGGTTVGTAASATAIVFGGSASPLWVLACAGVAAGLGGLAIAVERARAERRPELVDTRGFRSRPLHGWLYGVPIAAALPSLAWLAVVATLGWASWVPSVVFAMLCLGVAWGGQRVWSSHRLTRALEWLELGQRDAADRELERLSTHWFASRGVRSAARLNLAMLALNDGDGDAAIDWTTDPTPGSGAYPWAAVTRALGHLLRGDPPDEAEAWLTKAITGPGARAVQPEADAVRVLLVWRREGPAPGLAIAEELLSPASTTLHRALLMALRERAGDRAGADPLRTDEVEGLLVTGLGRAIPELRRPA